MGTNLKCGLEKSAGSTALFFFRRTANEVKSEKRHENEFAINHIKRKKRAHYNVTNVMQSTENRNEVRIVFSSYFHLLSIFHPNFRRKFSSRKKKFFLAQNYEQYSLVDGGRAMTICLRRDQCCIQ